MPAHVATARRPWPIALSVLVVDDEPEILEIACAYLATGGYAARRAGTAGRALDAFNRQPPDLLILDLILPDGAGEAVCAAVRRTSDVR